jgi:glutathione S-transferase
MTRARARPIRHFCRAHGGTEAQVRRDLAALPAMLDHIEALLDAGIVGAPAPNAADFQIATSIRVLSLLDDFAPLLLADRPMTAWAARYWPEMTARVPAVLPRDWVAAVR